MKIKGIDHVELTVTSLQKSVSFYKKLPGFKIVASYPSFVMFSCGNFKFGLTDHKQQLTTDRFNETNIGLDHLSFKLNSKEELEEGLLFLDNENIPHGDIMELSNKAYVLAFRDPDNIQLEFTWKEE